MTSSLVKLDRHNSVAHVIFNRSEKRNALNAEMLENLVRLLHECQADPTVYAIVISGSERGFAAGADIGSLAAENAIGLFTSGFSEHWDEVAAITKPLVAAVSSYALGGGLELVLICDIVVADATAVFGLPEASIGIIPGAGGTQRLVRAVGKSMAMEMILAGRKLSADEALAFGLVSTVVSGVETVEHRALDIAKRIAQAAPLAVTMAKAAILQSFETPLSAGIRYERALSALIASSEDRAEGIRAFSQKQTPYFKGK
ncbi:short chain enoyl-CoA hydratase [Rhizobium sp. PP-F2F-G20b]|nr:short chain enoyl-CoA hydratase [Rhizobium sp. PP-F2F-G20b]